MNKSMSMSMIRQILVKIRRILLFLVFWLAIYPIAHYFSWVDVRLEWVQDTWSIGFFILFSILASQIISYLIHSRWKIKKEFAKAPAMLIRISDILIYAVALKMILIQMDVNITPILTAFGVTSLAIGLAMQSSLSDFFAGLQLISDPMVQVGDLIQSNDITGTIQDITWRSTLINTFANNLVIIPNSTLLKSIVTNFDQPDKSCIFFFSAGISYHSSLDEAENTIKDIALNIQQSFPEPYQKYSPNVRYKAFGDSNIEFSVSIKLPKYIDTFPIRHQLIKSLKAKFELENIEISFPCRNVYLQSEGNHEQKI
jgi:small-conductance mechanosensitive channel